MPFLRPLLAALSETGLLAGVAAILALVLAMRAAHGASGLYEDEMADWQRRDLGLLDGRPRRGG